jgi:predicted transglutaminase-like cysteine proteinase
MSFPNIPNVTPTIDIDREDVINLLLASIAFEELGLAHIINSEAEKIQAVLGTLPSSSVRATTIADLLEINQSVNTTLKTVVKKEMLLQFKLEDVLEIPTT